MKGGSSAKGFTIVETLIVLAVTGALFASAMALVGGQQAKTEFGQSVREFESQLKDVANDVSTGTYNAPGNYSCIVDGGGNLVIQTTASAQGTNKDCVSIGRVVQPGFGADRDVLRIYTIVGKRLNTSGGDVVSLAEAQPKSLGRYTDTKLDGGLKVERVKYNPGSGPVDVGAFGFFTTFPTASTGGSGLASGNNTTDVYPLPITSLGDNEGPIEAAIVAMAGSLPPKDPSIEICIISGGTDQHALVTIGGTDGNGQLTTKLDIRATKVCP